jgi:hypothetical protein
MNAANEDQLATLDAYGDPHLDRTHLQRHCAFARADNAWQQRARLLQSLWREDHGWAAGFGTFGEGSERALRSSKKRLLRTTPLGWRLQEIDAYDGANFLTPSAAAAVQHAQENLEPGALMREDRLLANLLSSQPLCFNLFGDLRADLASAANALGQLLPELRIHSVQDILFEHSPGRSDPQYTNDRSAFDVAVRYTGDGGPGLIGIEVKYHEAPDSDENLGDQWAEWCSDITPQHRGEAGRSPLVQLARDHRLARTITANGDYPAGAVWLLLYPRGNTAMAIAAQRYLDITPGAPDRFVATLEAFVDASDVNGSREWSRLLRARYLDTDRIGALLAQESSAEPQS